MGARLLFLHVDRKSRSCVLYLLAALGGVVGLVSHPDSCSDSEK